MLITNKTIKTVFIKFYLTYPQENVTGSIEKHSNYINLGKCLECRRFVNSKLHFYIIYHQLNYNG